MSKHVTALVTAVVVAGLTLAATIGLRVTPHQQALVIGIATAFGAFLMPSLTRIVSAHERAVASVLSAVAVGLQLLFTVGVKLEPDAQAAVTTLLAAIASLLIPASAHAAIP